MTMIHCLVTNCEHNGNCYCTKLRVHFIGMKCMDIRLRLDVFRNVKGEILCLNPYCKDNRDKVCVRETLYVGGEGCITKEEWGKLYVGRSEGGRS